MCCVMFLSANNNGSLSKCKETSQSNDGIRAQNERHCEDSCEDSEGVAISILTASAGFFLMSVNLGGPFPWKKLLEGNLPRFVHVEPEYQLPNQSFQCRQMQTIAGSITCDCPCRVRKECALLLMSNALVVPLPVSSIL